MTQTIKRAVGAAFTAIAVLSLAGCQTPTERALQSALKACSAGNRQACSTVPMYQNEESLELQRRIDMIRAAAIGARIGGEIGQHLGGGPVTPTFTAPAPLPPPVTCTAMNLGGGMTTLSCP